MSVRPYNHGLDYDQLCGWYKGYGEDAPDLGLLPPTGYISDFGAIFVIKTDTDLCMLEHLIIDRDFMGDRADAVTDLAHAAIGHARASGFSLCWAFTRYPVVAKVAEKLGFRKARSFKGLWERGL